MYPKLTINTKKITENAQWVVDQCEKSGISVVGINKNTCQHPKVARALLAGGLTALGDSRMANLKGIADLPCEKWLIRIPMMSEVDAVVAYADVSVNSELSVIRALSAAAVKAGKTHKILVMVDLGDLREGYFDIDDAVEAVGEVLRLPHLDFAGIGVNLSCTGAIVPTLKTYEKFGAIQGAITERYGISCPFASGGASSTFYMVEDGSIPSCINNLRIGELILYGNDVSGHRRHPLLHHDAFILSAEVVEVKDKPSMPIGKIGRDAFGRQPEFIDRGIRHRVLCALGEQDTDASGLIPQDQGITVVAASSDHLILDVTDSTVDYQPGDIITFELSYGAGLHAFTSPYITQEVLD